MRDLLPVVGAVVFILGAAVLVGVTGYLLDRWRDWLSRRGYDCDWLD